LFFATTVAIATFTSKRWFVGPEPVADQGWPSLRSLAVVAPVLILIQIALGAAFRHGAMGLVPHVIGALTVTAAMLTVCAFVMHQFPDHETLKPAAIHLLGMTLFQIFLGIAAFWGRMVVETNPQAMLVTTILHVAGGGLTLACAVSLSIQI